CNFMQEVERERVDFFSLFTVTGLGCRGTWDSIACWDGAQMGETITIPCPPVLQTLFGRKGNFCDWFTVIHLLFSVWLQLIFYMLVQTLYTLGHSLSLIALITGSAILCLFRKLHCTRNYIHLNLFLSFILRAVAVLVKDHILFSRTLQCSKQPFKVFCLVFLQYFIMANFFWLLVEALYLHTLLIAIFSENKHFVFYTFIGWVQKHLLLFPLLQVNFIFFIRIICILVQKLRCPEVGGNDQSQYRRLAKSTLLLIPLFGIHYVVFVCLSESMAEDYKIFFDLALGSFQGLVVAVLYCFLNSEVRCELKRKWRSLWLSCRPSRTPRLNSALASRNGIEHMVQFHCNSRTQSILQSETSML
uniref:Vasoactive intestinal peptide receptor 2 n=1 Tax=Cynoglossus semilaevis TaxID=244447 RepID=A0A3P8X3P6_CYNSE